MAKELPYFKFYTQAYNSGNISICSFEAQGLFVNLCSLYWSEDGRVKLSKAKKRFYRASEEAWKELIDEGCIKVDDDNLTITFLDEQFLERQQLSEKNRINIEKRWKNKSVEIKPETKKKYHKNTSGKDLEYNIEEKRREEKRVDDSIVTTVLDNSSLVVKPANGEEKKKSIEERTETLRQQVMAEGSTTYTQRMLEDFIRYWSEPENKKNPKLKFELEKTWRLSSRLITWAGRGGRDYPCFLSEAEQSIELRRADFKKQLEPYLAKYGRDVLNEFYRYWTQPDKDGRLRWSREEFWDLKSRLASWKKSPPTGPAQEAYKIPVSRTQ